ncbi:hypothetical protein HPB50_025489 [Hyalomma asiaticum]|uniref:Uncharacterized protein n=1 Tax=Hyalomma asiaticum TaxID=266040 RepID=A0ACB7SKU5_HYAAI|nr:hypothetical protein HPB50_025489 [Hyalomma asiaticum]
MADAYLSEIGSFQRLTALAPAKRKRRRFPCRRGRAVDHGTERHATHWDCECCDCTIVREGLGPPHTCLIPVLPPSAIQVAHVNLSHINKWDPNKDERI